MVLVETDAQGPAPDGRSGALCVLGVGDSRVLRRGELEITD